MDELLAFVNSISLLLDEEYLLSFAVLFSELADVTKPPECRTRYGSKRIRIDHLKHSNGIVCSRLEMPFLFAFPKGTYATGRHAVAEVYAVVTGIAEDPQTLGVDVSHPSVPEIRRCL